MTSLGSGNSHNTGGGGGARNFFGSFSSSSNNSSANDDKHHHHRTQKGSTIKDKDSDNEAAATATPIHAASSSLASLPPSDHRPSSLQRSRSERRRRRTAASSSSSSHFASFTSAAAATSSSSRHASNVSSGALDHRDARMSAPRSSLRRHRHNNHVGTSLRFRQVDLDWTPDDDDDDDDGGHRVVDRQGEVEVEVVSSRTFPGPGRASRDCHGGLLGGGRGGNDGAVPDDADVHHDNNNNNHSDNDDDTAGDSTGMDIEVMDLRPAAHPSAMMMAVTSSFVSMSSRVSIESDDLNGLFLVAIATDDGHNHDHGNGNDRDPLEERPEHWVTASEIVDEENGPSVVVDVPSAMTMMMMMPHPLGGGATASASSSVPREERPGQTSIRSGSRTRRRLFGNVAPLFSNLSSTLSSLRHHHYQQQRRRHQQRRSHDEHSLTHRTHSSIGSMDGSGSEIWTGASHSLRSSNSTIDSHPSVPSYHGRGVPGKAGAGGGAATTGDDEDGSDTSSWAVVDLLGRRKWYVARIVKVAFGVVALAALMGSVLYLVLEEEEDAGGGGRDGWVGPSLFSRSSSNNALFGDWFVSVEDKGMESGGSVGGGGGNGARAMMNGDVLMLPHDEGYERDARHEDLRLARRRERERRRKEERMQGRREERIASQQRGIVHP